MTLRLALKRSVQGVALALVLPFTALSGFGRIRAMYTLFAHAFALAPGMPGDFLRSAYYRLTATSCSIDTVISFGTFFSTPDVSIAHKVSIGSYCVISKSRIGPRTQIASHVEIHGRYQHDRDEAGRLLDFDGRQEIVIGADCWIGSSAVVMAGIGPGSTIGSGSVVVKSIPAGVIAAGNPARVIRPAGERRPDAETSMHA